MSNIEVKSTNSVERQNSIGSKTEVFVGANKLPKKLYLLIDAAGNSITDESVTHNELIAIILDSEVIYSLDQRWSDSDGHGEEARCEFNREFAIEEAKEAGYRVIEVLK